MRNHFLVIIMLLTVLVLSTGIYPVPAQAQNPETITLSNRPIIYGCGERETRIRLRLDGLDMNAFYRMRIHVRQSTAGPFYMTREIIQQPGAATVDPFSLIVFNINDLNSSPTASFPLQSNNVYVSVRIARSMNGVNFTNVRLFEMLDYRCDDGSFGSIRIDGVTIP